MDRFHILEFINKRYKSYQKNSLEKEKNFDVIYVQGQCDIDFNIDQFVQIHPVYGGNKIHITSDTFSFIPRQWNLHEHDFSNTTYCLPGNFTLSNKEHNESGIFIINYSSKDTGFNIHKYPERWNEKHWVFRTRDNNSAKNAKPLQDFKNIDNNIYVLDKKLPYTLIFTETGRWSCSVKNTNVSFPYVERLKKLNANLILIKQSYKDAIMQAGEFGINNMELSELAEYIKTLIPNTKKYVFYGEGYNYFTSLYFASKIENSDCVSCIFYRTYENFLPAQPLLHMVKKRDKIPINLIQCIKDMQGMLHIRLAPYNEPSMEEILTLHGHLNSKLNVTIFSLKDLLRWNRLTQRHIFQGCGNLFPLFASPAFKDWSLNRYLALPD
tara:strand:- start:2130 stop:3275 length:1146 start_codon:yes stop_codon:yes gene_type:complete